jgi:hypothetical protein
MSLVREFRAYFTQEDGRGLQVGLYGEDGEGQQYFIDAEEFGPFDTATDVLQWTVRHLAPRLRLPLR